VAKLVVQIDKSFNGKQNVLFRKVNGLFDVVNLLMMEEYFIDIYENLFVREVSLFIRKENLFGRKVNMWCRRWMK